MPRSSQNERGEREDEADEVDREGAAPRGVRAAHPRPSKIFFE
jgi:hypothetical protein